MKTTNDFKFDAAAIFDRYGGVSSVSRMLYDAGIKVNVRTLRKQRERGVIPPAVLASIAYASMKAGMPVNFNEFLLTRESEE